MCDGRDDDFGSGAVSKTPSPSTRIVTGSGGKVKGAYLRVEISARKYNPNPLELFSRKHSHSGGERKRFPLLPNGECRGSLCLQNESIVMVAMLSNCKHGSARGCSGDPAKGYRGSGSAPPASPSDKLEAQQRGFEFGRRSNDAQSRKSPGR